MRISTIENELANALFRLSFGKLTFKQAQNKSKEVASNFDIDDEMRAHKGINWHAKEVLKKMCEKTEFKNSHYGILTKRTINDTIRMYHL